MFIGVVTMHLSHAHKQKGPAGAAYAHVERRVDDKMDISKSSSPRKSLSLMRSQPTATQYGSMTTDKVSDIICWRNSCKFHPLASSWLESSTVCSLIAKQESRLSEKYCQVRVECIYRVKCIYIVQLHVRTVHVTNNNYFTLNKL